VCKGVDTLDENFAPTMESLGRESRIELALTNAVEGFTSQPSTAQSLISPQQRHKLRNVS
jgi:hypothetical protein